MTQENSLRKNASLNIIKNLMGLIFPLITFPYVSRVLGPDGVGKVNFAGSVVGYFILLAMLGIGSYGTREAAKLRNDSIALSNFVKEIVLINIVSTLFSYSIFLIVLFFPRFSEYRTLLLICSFSIVFTCLGLDWLYMAMEDFAYITIRSIFFQFVSLVLLFCFVRDKNDYSRYALIGVISAVGSNICNFFHARKYISIRPLQNFNIKKHLPPIFTMFLMGLSVNLYSSVDVTLLGLISGDEQVGIYTAATRINTIVISIITAGSAVVLPRLSFYKSENSEEQFRALVQKSFCFLVLLSIPATVGIFLIAHPVILLLCGEKYFSSIVVMKVMSCIIFLLSFTTFVGVHVFIPLEKERITVVSLLLGVLINCLLNLIVIPRFQALGAGLASIFSAFVVSIIQFSFVKQYLLCRETVICLFQAIFSSTCMFILLRIILNLQLGNLVGLIISIVIGAVSYLIILLVLRNPIVIEAYSRLRGITK